MAIICSPDEHRPTHHIKLSKGGEELGLILCDVNGKVSEEPIERRPYPTHALKTYSGEGTYSDEEPPFNTLAQDDFSLGRGKLVFDEETGRYFDGFRIDTTDPDRVILGGQEIYCSGQRDLNQMMPGSPSSLVDANFMTLYGSSRYRASMFTAGANYSAEYIELWLKYTGSPGTLTAAIYSDSGSNQPYLLLQSATISKSNADDKEATLIKFDITTLALTSGNKYHVVVYGAATDDASNHWLVLGTLSGINTANTSEDGSSWAGGYGPYYRVIDADDDFSGIFFEYKRALYLVMNYDDGGNSYLYLNGDRGVADANTGNLDKLIDDTKSGWVADEYNGCIVILIAGPGSEESQPWRRITDTVNGGAGNRYLSVTPSWNVVHTTETEYVIVGSNKFQSILDLGGVCTGATVADDFVYFARGDTGSLMVLRYQWYNNGGVATERNDAEDQAARHIIAFRDAGTGKNYILGANNKRGSPWFRTKTVWKGQVPEAWGDLYYDMGEIAPTDEPWDEGASGGGAIANVTQGTQNGMTKINVASDFTTGRIASIEIDASNLMNVQKVGFMIKSSAAISENVLRLIFDDEAFCAGPEYYNLPALSANEWTWVVLDITPYTATSTAVDYSAIISVGMDVNSDQGAFILYIYGGIRALASNVRYYDMPTEAQITGVGLYAGSIDDPRENPWIVTENKVYEFQTQNNDAITPLALDEMRALRSEINGRANTTNGVYFWFNLGRTLQRYYNRQMDNIGPDLDEGLPEDRDSLPYDLVSYPGTVYVDMDGGSSNYSSILNYVNSGWHEVYRSPRTGARLRGMTSQEIPYLADRLWFVQGSDIVWVPVSLNPTQDDKYRYHFQGSLITGRYYHGRRDMNKFWYTLKLDTENLTTGGGTYDIAIAVDYRTESYSGWTEISDEFDTSPFQKIAISSSYDIASKWIQFRLRFRTNETTITPELHAAVIASLMRLEIKWSYPIQFRLMDDDNDLNGMPDGQGTAQARAVKFDGWLSSDLPIYQETVYPLAHQVYVYPDPESLRLSKRIEREGKRGWIARAVLIEI